MCAAVMRCRLGHLGTSAGDRLAYESGSTHGCLLPDADVVSIRVICRVRQAMTQVYGIRALTRSFYNDPGELGITLLLYSVSSIWHISCSLRLC